MGRVVHFEIYAEEPERAKIFYERVFDWKINKWNGPVDYWLVITSVSTNQEDKEDKATEGIDGAITRRQGKTPPKDNEFSSYVCTIEVDNIDDICQSIKKHGGEIVKPRIAIPGVGWMAYCRDTENNVFSVLQTDEQISKL